MPEHQISLPLHADDTSAPATTESDLRREIAEAWSLPLGQRVEIFLHGDLIDPLVGTLQLISAPDYPWNPRQPLQLRLAGFAFSSRDIERWTRL